MSVDTLVEREKGTSPASRKMPPPAQPFWKEWLGDVINIISSLRLTVIFLFLAVVLVFIGTLAQRTEGLLFAQNRYFRSLFIWWAPAGGQWKIPVFPGGYFIGGVLLINLLAAHARRFKFSKKKIGIFVIHAGLVLMILGQFATDLFSKEAAMQLYEGEAKNFAEAFHEDELVIVDTSDSQHDRVYSIPAPLLARKAHKDDLISNPKLPLKVRVRDFWQNCDVEVRPPPEAIPTKADQGIFKDVLLLPLSENDGNPDQKSAAVLVEVLSQKGSLGTFLVPTSTPEQEQQTFKAGNKEFSLSLLFAPMLGGNQLILSETSAPRGDHMVAIPESEFKTKEELKRDTLPFTLRVKEFWPYCRLYRKPGANSVFPEITQGRYRGAVVTPLPRETDPEKRNYPGALIELVGDQGSLGAFLVYAGSTNVNRFQYKAKPFELTLRFTRYYYPFQLTLLKATNEQYRGTDIPKNFASRVRVEDPESNEARETVISMNNPLSYAGLTFFQYQMSAGQFAEMRGLRPTSTFEVVHNPSRRTPYIACIMVASGLIIQFMSHLIGFVRKRRTA